MLKRRTGINLQAVAYKSALEGITDVVARRVSMMFENDPTRTLPGQYYRVATCVRISAKACFDVLDLKLTTTS
jgi:hypothetical protein